VFSKLYDHPALEKAGFRSATVRNLIIATALLIIAIPLINTLSIWNKGIHFPASLKSAEEAFRNMTKEYEQRVSTVINMPDQFTLLLNILVMAVLPAIAEELFFRGCMQQIFQRWLKNSLLAVIVTAVIFSAFHFDFYGFFPRIVLGMILGWLFAKTGSLLPGILAHFMNNAMALLFTYVGQHSPVQKNFATEDLNIPMWTGFISLVAVLFLITRLTRDHCFDYPEKNNFTFENIQ
jgi:membrane protease YdiL (CAAX protease family)